ncbi:MAG: HTH domain-containing protein [Azoarcus sp.]|nr:HTH domain-containing protein [Azoarcus sp.]
MTHTLHIEIQPARAALDRFGMTLASTVAREHVAPYFGVGFETMAQFTTVFTTRRWELVEALKATGPLTIYALAKHLGRHYRNVHKDVSALMDWMVVEKNEEGRVFVPWDEIEVRWPLLSNAA